MGVSAELLIVAGGGGGWGGGGGGGGLLYFGSETPKTPDGAALTLATGTTYTITIGAGGTSGTSAGNGGDSSFIGGDISEIAIGGGYGGAGGAAGTGGSGGGAERSNPTVIGSGTSGQGYDGGQGYYNNASGGGGGAGGLGGDASAGTGGDGGAGLTYEITGTATGYAGGGGGGGSSIGGTATDGGADGSTINAGAATANTGGGGGGIYNSGYTDGADGVVIVRAKNDSATVTGTYTEIVDGDYYVYVFTGDGTITFAPTLWTPAEITTDLWLDSSDESTITTDTGVSQWSDKSGNDNHATQATAANQPLSTTETLDDGAVITFDGGDDSLVFTNTIDTVGKALFFVLKNTEALYSIFLGSTAANLQYRVTGTAIQIVGSPTLWGNACTAGTMTNSEWHVLALIGTADGLDIYVDGTLVDSTDTAQSSAVTVTGLSAWSATSGQYPFGGSIARVLVCDADIDRELLEGYLAWDCGLEGNLPASHTYYNAAPALDDGGEGTSIRLSVSQVFTLPERITLEQVFALPERLALEQVFALPERVTCKQVFFDAPVIRKAVLQIFNDAVLIRRGWHVRFGDMIQLRKAVEQIFAIPELLRLVIEQDFAVCAAAIRKETGIEFAIKDIELLRKDCYQMFVVGGVLGESRTYDLAVAIGGASVENPSSITIERDEDLYYIEATLTVAGQSGYKRYVQDAPVVITVDGQEYVCMVTTPKRSRRHGGGEYSVICQSPAVMLGSEYAAQVDAEYYGFASAIAQELADVAGVVVDWRAVDQYYSLGECSFADVYPIDAIRELSDAVGAYLQSDPDGTLVVKHFPRLDQLADQVAYSLSDVDHFFEVSEEPVKAPGYTAVVISDQNEASDSLRLETEDIDSRTKEVRGYQTPWDGDFGLTHTGGSWVYISSQGARLRTETEVVEFVDGEASTSYPIYSWSSLDWLENNLGTITFSEDGSLSASVAGDSLLEITYTTKCRVWEVTDSKDEQLQLVAETG